MADYKVVIVSVQYPLPDADGVPQPNKLRAHWIVVDDAAPTVTLEGTQGFTDRTIVSTDAKVATTTAIIDAVILAGGAALQAWLQRYDPAGFGLTPNIDEPQPLGSGI